MSSGTPYSAKSAYQPIASAPPPNYASNQDTNVNIHQPGFQYGGGGPAYSHEHYPPPPPPPPPQQYYQPYHNQPAPQPHHHYQHQGYYQAGAPPVYQGAAVPPGYQPILATPNIAQPKPSVVIVGGCPACRVGVLEDDFTCLGVCCAIFFFPLGILCCLAMRQRRCPNCGANFS